jgi:hypothetical protein
LSSACQHFGQRNRETQMVDEESSYNHLACGCVRSGTRTALPHAWPGSRETELQEKHTWSRQAPISVCGIEMQI